MPTEWYYLSSGQEYGPVSSEELKSLAASGGLLPTDQIWKEGMPDWVGAFTTTGLQFPKTEVVQQLPVFEKPSTGVKATMTHSELTEPRYPHLEQYLKWLSLLASIGVCVTTLISIPVAGVSFFLFPDFASKGLGILTGIAIGVVGWFVYVMSLASVELLRIMVDIEPLERQQGILNARTYDTVHI